MLHPDEWYRSRQIDLLVGKKVETIATEAKTVGLDDGTSYRVIHEQTESDFQHVVFQDGKMVGAILLGSTEAAAKIKMAIEGKRDFSALLSASPDCASILAAL
jgi:NAD(P)H-nitrite reductase large subunit